MAAENPENAPTINPQRGPNVSATHPVIGAPKGVQPITIDR